MINIQLEKLEGIATLEPEGALSAEDFQTVSDAIDPYIEEHGSLRGLIIHTEAFPGWDSFGGMLGHFRFVREHHKHLTHVALVTDSELGNFAEKVAGHFLSAEVRNFDFDQMDLARAWILGN